MNRRLTVTVVVTAITLGWLPVAAGGAGDNDLTAAAAAKLAPPLRAAFERGDERLAVIVSLRDGGELPSDPARRVAAVRAQVAAGIAAVRGGLEADAVVPGRRFELNPAFTATVSRAGLLALARRDDVAAVEADAMLPLHTAEGMAVIHADTLQNYGISGDDTAVAIIDTGIDYYHPALGGGAIPNVKVVRGVDVADDDDDPYDCSGHGTAVAAVAAGASYQWSPNRRFAGGVAPDAHILAYKAAPDSDCTGLLQSALIAAIEDAVIHRNGPDYRLAAINISAGSGRFTGACDADAVSFAAAVRVAVANGIAVVASAGNDGTTGELPLPACLSEVISVGSVWDTTPVGAVGFCLDATCEQVCTDQGDQALTVACYSNSSPMLDLLAPSEVLTTAARDGQTIDFGGTSGAAPYATGAIALLSDALPSLDPTALRLLLALTGQPVVNPRTGAMTPLLDLERALDLDGVALGTSSNVALPRRSPSSFADTAWIDADGLVGALRVIIRLVYPEPSRLRLTLVSPAGTVVTLHDPLLAPHGGDPGGPTAPGGIFGVYPDTVTPADDLGDLANQPLRGAWSLVVESDGLVSDTAVDPILVGWGLAFEAKVAPQGTAATSLFIPVVARTAGSLATRWTSDLRLLNPAAAATAAVRLYLVPSGANGQTSFEQRDLLLPPETLLALDDVLASRFGLEQATGQVIIQSLSGSLVASSRSSTAATGGGSTVSWSAPSPGATAAASGTRRATSCTWPTTTSIAPTSAWPRWTER